MASKIGSETSYLEQDLLENSSSYDYFQAVRMIELLGRQNYDASNPTTPYKLNIKPKLSFEYPVSDISDIEVVYKNEKKEYLISTTFMGLYGVSSPLPAYFTEELLDDEWNDINAPKEFIDVIHQHLYPLLYKAWLKYKFTHNAIEKNNSDYWGLLYSLIGLGSESIISAATQSDKLIRYIGLLTYRSKSVVGLQTLLQDFLSNYQVEITTCVTRNVPVPNTQRLFLGDANCSLGEDAVVGATVIDRSGKFIINIGPVNENEYINLVSDSSKLEFVKYITKSYLAQPLEFELVAKLRPSIKSGVVLGCHNWSALGRDSWLGIQDEAGIVDILIS